MAYVVLARSCRPQTFGEVLGQDHVVTTLRNTVGQNRIAHAYLFSGPRGTGKTTVARILAKALNCPDRDTEEPCGLCAGCREIRDGISIDVREIDGASNRGIDEIRELKEHIRFAPVSSRYKIYIIDEVHMLTKEAFNALLKTLEEPPPHVIFMFATTEIHRVPATILSRCQHFDFKRITVARITDSLATIAGRHDITISAHALALIARSGEGSLRDAQTLFDQVISYAGTTIDDREVEEILGITDRRYTVRLADAVLGRDAGDCLRMIDELYSAGEDLRRFRERFARYLMGLLTAGISDDAELLDDFTEDEQEALRRQAAQASGQTVTRLLDLLLSSEEDMRRTSDPRIHFEYLLVKMARLEPVLPVDEMIERLERLETRLGVGEPPSPAARGPAPVVNDGYGAYGEPESVSGAASSGEAESSEAPLASPDLWTCFRERLKQENPIVFSKIAQARLVEAGSDTLLIGVPRGFVFLDHLREPETMDLMDRVARFCAGEPVTVRIEEVDDREEEAAGGAANGRRTVGEIKSEALRHPLVQKVMDVFDGAEVRDVKIRNGTT